MRYKKLLLVTFFLSLFVLQQTHVGAQKPLKENSAQQNGLLPTLYVRMYRLNLNGSVALGRIECTGGDNSYGCVENPETQFYPYDFTVMQLAYDADPNNNQQIDMEADYLLDVLSHEMDVPNYPNLVPLQAQAVAARSFADYNFRSQNGMINNSTEDHVFVPYAFESYLQNTGQQDTVRNAVTLTSKYYLAQGGSPINAEFASDSAGSTISSTNPLEPYLLRVEDPISTLCGSIDYGQDATGKVRGMSQKGANRWALGDQCANQLDRDQFNGGTKLSWSVTWSDYRQILAHYYTGIDILDASGNKVAPDDRWNLLKYELPNGATVTAGAPFNVHVILQNTSTTNWADSPVVMGYKWRETDNWTDISNTTIPDLTKGASSDPTNLLSLSIPVPSDLTDGMYTLHLDLRHQNNANGWFSNGANGGWPDLKMNVNVAGSGGSVTPTLMPTFTPTSALTNGFAIIGDCPNRVKHVVSAFSGTGVGAPSGVGTKWYIYNNICGYPLSNSFPIYYSVTINRFNLDPSSATTALLMIDTSGGGDVILDTKVIEKHVPYTWTGTFTGFTSTWTNYISVTTGNLQAGDVYTIEYEFYLNNDIASTPTPAPTPCTMTCAWNPCTSASQIVNSKVASLAKNATFTMTNSDRISEQADLLYRVRDEILNNSQEGQRYSDLYYKHSAEIAAIMYSSPEIAEQGFDAIDTLTPNLQALLDGQGNNSLITSQQVQETQAFLNVIFSNAGPQLKQDIADEQARRPLENLIGMNMNEAWNYLNGYRLKWLPPISSANLYSTQQGSVIPIKFTVNDGEGNFIVDPTLTLQVLDSNGNLVLGPIQVSNNPKTGIIIQGGQYHYSLYTKSLPADLYTLQVIFPSISGTLPDSRSIILTRKK